MKDHERPRKSKDGKLPPLSPRNEYENIPRGLGDLSAEQLAEYLSSIRERNILLPTPKKTPFPRDRYN